MPESYIDGVKVDYKVHSVKQIMTDGTEVIYTERDKLTWYFNELLWNGLQFDRWFFGHYHDNKQIMGKFILLYEQIIRIA